MKRKERQYAKWMTLKCSEFVLFFRIGSHLQSNPRPLATPSQKINKKVVRAIAALLPRRNAKRITVVYRVSTISEVYYCSLPRWGMIIMGHGIDGCGNSPGLRIKMSVQVHKGRTVLPWITLITRMTITSLDVHRCSIAQLSTVLRTVPK